MKPLAFHILIVLLLMSCNRPIEEIYPEDDAKRNVPVYIVSIAWHTTITMESDQFAGILPEHPQMPEARYLMFGWGDRGYYPNPDPGTGDLLKAALLPTESVLHVIGIDMPVEQYFSNSRVVRIQVTERGAENLARFIADHFKRDAGGNPVVAADGLYRNSLFFESRPSYFFPRTSNRWVAQALRRTGYPITPFYAITADNVMNQAGKYGEVIR